MLTEAKIVKMILEEYDRRAHRVLSEVELDPFPGQEYTDEPIISPHLKVRHVNTQLLYTIDSVSPRDITLRSPEGDLFTVDSDEFEKEYKLD